MAPDGARAFLAKCAPARQDRAAVRAPGRAGRGGFEAAKVVVSGAGAFTGDHARTDRLFGGARLAEHPAFPRADLAPEHLAALACPRISDPHPRDLEQLLGVVLS